MSLLCLGLMNAAVSGLAAPRRITLAKYPNLKIGFSTGNFTVFLPINVENAKRLLEFAGDHGFAFIELRDPNTKLTSDECKEISEYAKIKNIEVIYAVMAGGLDPDYQAVFSRSLANARAFNGPRMIRTAAGGSEFSNDPGKSCWNAVEFGKLVQSLNQAGKMAKMLGWQLVIENGKEALWGDGVESFGTADIFGIRGVDANVGFQLDVANFFCVSRQPGEPAAVRNFFESNVDKVGYTHLKTSRNHKAQPVLGPNELSFDVYFAGLEKHAKHYVAIELTGNAGSLNEVFKNHINSIDYLTENY
jgi:hypothetical protein